MILLGFLRSIKTLEGTNGAATAFCEEADRRPRDVAPDGRHLLVANANQTAYILRLDPKVFAGQ